MKKITVLILVALLVIVSGCGKASNSLKHFHSWATGLDRTITLYNADGKTNKVWRTKAQIEDKGGTVYFLDANGKAVTISGTFVIQEN